MKKTFWIFATLMLFFVGDRLAGWVLKTLLADSQFRYSRLYQGEAEADILLVGNSRGLIFYQPYIEEITGKSTFNVSYNGMPIDLGRTLVEDYFEKYEAPQLMVLDVTMCDRENTQLVSGFNLYTPYSDNLFNLVLSHDRNSAYAGQLSHLYLHNSEIFQRGLYYYNKSDEDWLLDRVINEHMVNTVEQQKVDTIKWTNKILAHLKATVDLAKSKGTKVHLVVNPYYPPYAKRIPNLNEFRQSIERFTGEKVHDYAQSVSDLQGFGDYQHLNKHGARLYIDLLK
ncbi:MAG: hypothetical protein AAF985_23360, partial [Bacteroidota bacterium]